MNSLENISKTVQKVCYEIKKFANLFIAIIITLRCCKEGSDVHTQKFCALKAHTALFYFLLLIQNKEYRKENSQKWPSKIKHLFITLYNLNL